MTIHIKAWQAWMVVAILWAVILLGEVVDAFLSWPPSSDKVTYFFTVMAVLFEALCLMDYSKEEVKT